MKKFSLLIFLVALVWSSLAAQDCQPQVVLLNGIAININYVDGDGDGTAESAAAKLDVNDLIRYGTSACNAYPLTFSIDKSNNPSGFPPTNTSLSFSCDEVGVQAVQVWVKDANGNTNYAETYVIINDSQGLCGLNNEFESVSASCTNDEVPPSFAVMNGYTASLLQDGTGNGKVTVFASSFIISKSDNCSAKTRVRIGKINEGNNQPPATNAVTFDCSELGINTVEIWVGDESGNWDFIPSYIRVEDENFVCDKNLPVGCTPDSVAPDVLAYNGITGVVNQEGTLTLKARDFLRRKSDNCGFAPLVQVSKEDLSAPPQNTVTFTCDELGTQFVYLWVRDLAGNWSKTFTYVQVQDNLGSCGNDRSAQQLWPEYLNEYMSRFQHPAQRHATSETAISVSPNPFHNRFQVQVEHTASGPLHIALFDAYGKQLQVLANNQWTNAGTFTSTFDATSLPAGTYWCVVQSNGQTSTMAVVKL